MDASMTRPADYIGRFAPSPSGPLHAGSLVAAMASYLDARAHHGRWLVRIEDVDEARTVPGADASILRTLAAFGMLPDGEVIWQSRRGDAYAAAFERLHGHVYPCGCSRREIADSNAGAAMHGPAPYPGTCRDGMAPGRVARAWRLRVPATGDPDECIGFMDRVCGWHAQHLATEAGDFVLKRADGFWAYQLAVVVDDAAQGVTHVVRGMDLLDSTPRQIWLQRLLKGPTPRYLHTPLVRNAAGEKLSKQTGAAPLETGLDGTSRMTTLVATLASTAAVLGLQVSGSDVASPEDFWRRAIPMWAARFGDDAG